MEAWRRFSVLPHQQIIWVKDRALPGRSHFPWQHEPCLFGWQEGHRPKKVGSERPSTVWRVPIGGKPRGLTHPTSKPVELFALPMRVHTVRGDVCYEPFAGSGSQLLAAERVGRRCFAMELDQRYCDMIVRRWITAARRAGKPVPGELLERFDPAGVEA